MAIVIKTIENCRLYFEYDTTKLKFDSIDVENDSGKTLMLFIQDIYPDGIAILPTVRQAFNFPTPLRPTITIETSPIGQVRFICDFDWRLYLN